MMNGNYQNGNGNGNGNGKHRNGVKSDSRVLTATSKSKPTLIKTEHHKIDIGESIVLRQSPMWSRTIMLTLIGLACFGIGWANIAKIEQVIPATGQLKPQAAAKEVQAPFNGVVKQVYVKDGQQVKPGDLLLTFDSDANTAELSALNKVKTALLQENQIYRGLLGTKSNIAAQVQALQANIPPEAAFLMKNRATLIADNELLRTELRSGTATNLGAEEQARLQVAKRELESRAATARLEVEQIKKQLAQNQVKLADTKSSLAIQQQVLAKLKILAEEGGISQLQYINQQQQVQNLGAEIAQLEQEQQRLQFDILQGGEELTTTVAVTNKTTLDKINDNNKRIAEIDSQITKIVLDNDKQLAEINGKIAQAQLNVKYQVLRATVGGTIFDLQAKTPGFVANSSQKLLTIVPNDNFIVEAFITNKDIGFVREGMKVDVRIDSFPYSEFGDIKGKVVGVGSDALPPDETHQYYRFPTKISLDQQKLNIRGKDISLQSGMSVSANIKVREERTVMSLFTELFTNQVESLKQVR
jgi:HlyD family secretion protein